MSTAASSTRPGTSMPGRRTGGNDPAPVGVAATTPASDGTNSRTATAANMATGTASRNSACQPNAPTSRPPMNGPIAALIEVSMSNRPNAAPRRSTGAMARTSASEVVEISAPLERLEDARQRQDRERGRDRGQQRRQREGDDADEEDRPLAVSVAEAAAGQQRDRHRAQVQGDQRRDRDGVDAEVVHDARQGDGQHRRVERHEHGAAGHAQHRRADAAAPRRGPVTGGARSPCSRRARRAGRRRSAASRRRCRRPPAGRTRAPRRPRATGRRPCR